MKKIIILGILNFLFLISVAQSSSFIARLTTNDEGYLVYQIQQTSGTTHPDAAHLIGDITFSISWQQSLGADVDVRLLCTNNDYNIEEEGAGKRTASGIYFRKDATYSANNFAPPESWVNGTWYTIAKFKVTNNSSGSGDFSLYTSAGFNFSFDEDGNNSIEGDENFTPTINSGDGTVSNYSFPTSVYDYVWVGGNSSPPFYDGNSWAYQSNWTDECGSTASAAPANTNNCYIPGGLTDYPSNIYTPSAGFPGTGVANNVKIASGGEISIGNTSHQDQLTFSGNLSVYGTLNILPDGWVTVNGNTYIDDAEGIIVQASSDGVGSFIDNGTITYGTSGTGKVQTYLSNAAGAGDWYLHTVGPTVDIGGAGGAHLSDFNVANGNTYAYRWDDTQDTTTGSAWVNVYSNSYLVETTDGIALGTNDNTAYTLDMTGSFITGNTTSYSFSNSANNNTDLISNPYPSAIDFDAFATDAGNSSVIANKNWIWDPSSGNYLARAGGSGGQQYIQVGQAFFVETTSAGTVTFKNSFRTHSDAAFRDVNPNELTMKVSGGDYGFKDELVVRFVEDATFGYDEDIDAQKINSMYENATQIESVSEDGARLSVNFLPVDGLNGDMVSVPVNFRCGFSGEYTFDFEGIESFENGNEIWLEDKKENDSWIYLNNNPHYTFSAVPYEPHDRFILHFFGPTGINKITADNPVEIYSYRQYAYIKKTDPNEVIKKVSVYNINGEELFSKRVPDQPVNKLWVSEQVGYYLVKVITDKKTYTGKIFIFK